MIWRDNGLNHLALLRRDFERSNAMQASTPDRPVYDTGIIDLDPLPDALGGYLTESGELAPSGAQGLPRVRINLKQLANKSWQQDVTLETFDCDPASSLGGALILKRLNRLHAPVEIEIARRMGQEPTGA